MNILVLDNYDSFTFNLVQYIQEILGRDVDVCRNDALTLDEVDRYDAIVLSPGPGIPEEAGIMPELIKRYAPTKAILGVCLGHQAIGEAFGAKLLNLSEVYHGIETPIQVTDPTEPVARELGRHGEAKQLATRAMTRALAQADELAHRAKRQKEKASSKRERTQPHQSTGGGWRRYPWA